MKIKIMLRIIIKIIIFKISIKKIIIIMSIARETFKCENNRIINLILTNKESQ